MRLVVDRGLFATVHDLARDVARGAPKLLEGTSQRTGKFRETFRAEALR